MKFDMPLTRAPSRFPVLTEVVAVPERGEEASEPPSEESADPGQPAQASNPSPQEGFAAPLPPLDEAQVIQRVLLSLETQLDGVFEQRMHDSLVPAFARLADTLMRETRDELTAALRDMVVQAVASELARHRTD